MEPRRLLALTGAQVYTTAALTTPGLVGSYVNQSLQGYTPQDDWRTTQTISGTRVDPAIDFPTPSFGTRSAVGVTGGTDADWDDFSVQWDGYLKVTAANARLATKSDDGSRMWIDLNGDGVFDPTGPEFLDNHWGQSQADNTGDRSVPLPAGVYKVRIQYYEGGGGNSMALVSSPLVPQSMPVTATDPKQVVKVLVLDYDPRVPGSQNRPLHDVMGWTDPRALAAGYEQDMEWASGGAVDFQVVDWRDLDEMPVFSDGFRYNPDDYVQRYRSNGPWHTDGGGWADFYAMADEQHLADLVNSGAVDELWTFAGPFMGISAESFMAGPNSFFVNGPTYPDFPVDRAIVGYGFNYERGVAEMIHDNGHRTENHLSRAYGGTWNFSSPVTMWDKFSADYGQAAAGPYGVGNTHFPANGASDYDYASTRAVTSTALDWVNYPNLTGATTTVTRDNWGWGTNASDYQRDYLDWFFSLLPRSAGTTLDGRQNNWYEYIYDFNSYEPNTGLPRQEDAFASPGVIRTAGGTTWTFTVRYYDVTGVNTSTLDGSDVRVTGPNGFSALASLVSVGPQVATTAGTARTVTYRVSAPGGTWDALDVGTYTISLQSSQVRDTLGNSFPAGGVGTFRVDIPDTSRIGVNAAVAAGHATVTNTTLDIGPVANMFDGSTSTLVRTPNISPAFFQVAFDAPQTLRGFRAYFAGGASYQWNVETADTQADMDAKAGTWRQAVATTSTFSDQYSVVTLPSAVTAKIVRLNVTRTSGDNYVHVNEWQILGPPSTDTAPPVASLPLANVTTPGATSYFLPVTYTDATGVSVPSLDNADLLVTGPSGFSAPATFYGVDNYLNGPTRTAQYYFVPPGGSWDVADDGTYTITLRPAQVLDTVGNASTSAIVLGSFTVNIPPPVRRPTYDLTEMNAAQWSAGADGATASTSDDTTQKVFGNASVKFVTTGGFDTWLSFPPAGGADWDLTAAHNLYFSVLAQNPSSIGFQQDSPLIRLRDPNGGYFEFAYYQNGGQYQLLNDARGTWRSYTVPLNASASQNNGWRRTVVGSPRMDHIQSVEFHADTWDAGFTLWYDRVGFDLPVSVTAASFQAPPAGQQSLVVSFDENVGTSLADADLQLRNRLTNALVPVHATLDPSGKVATFTFPSLPGQRLPSGMYRATLPAGAVADPAGNASAAAYTYDFILVNDGDAFALPAGQQSYVVQQLAIVGTGSLDLADDSLLVDYTGATPLATIRQLLLTGRNGGTWDGPGIRSSAAAASVPNGSIAYAEASTLGLTSFNGQPVDTTRILLRYAPTGDANVDGKLDGDDLALADRGKAKGLGTWVAGDFDYDGAVTAADYALLDRALSPAAPPAPDPAAGQSAQPTSGTAPDSKALDPSPAAAHAVPPTSQAAPFSVRFAAAKVRRGRAVTLRLIPAAPSAKRHPAPARPAVRAAVATRYLIDWDDDGRTDEVVAGNRPIALRHTYRRAGAYRVTVTALGGPAGTRIVRRATVRVT